MLSALIVSGVIAASAIADCPGLTIFSGDGIQSETDGGHLRAPASAPDSFGRGIVMSGDATCLEETLGWHGSLPLTWHIVDAVFKSEYVYGSSTTRVFTDGRLELRDAAGVLVLSGRVIAPTISWNSSTHTGSIFGTANFVGGTLYSALAIRNGIIVNAVLSDAGDETGWNAAVALNVMYPPYLQPSEGSASPADPAGWGRLKSSYR